MREFITEFVHCIQDGWAALHFSAWAGRLEVLEELLKHRAEVNMRDKVCSLKMADQSSFACIDTAGRRSSG